MDCSITDWSQEPFDLFILEIMRCIENKFAGRIDIVNQTKASRVFFVMLVGIVNHPENIEVPLLVLHESELILGEGRERFERDTNGFSGCQWSRACHHFALKRTIIRGDCMVGDREKVS